MKKIKIMLISAILIISFFGCGEQGNKSGGKIIAVSSITIINDMVKNIGRDKVDAVSICGIGTDPHTYKAVPEDSRTIAKSDIIFVNGLGLEGWINKLIESAGEDKQVITVTNGLTPLKDSLHSDPDPHCWFNAEYAKKYVDNIAEGLSKIDPSNKKLYFENAQWYKQELDSLHMWAVEEIKKIPERKRILVTSHDAFRYFGEAYGLQVEALQGISTDARVQTADVARLVNLIKSTGISAVFIETSVNPKLLEQISKETDAIIGGVLFSDAIDAEGTPGGSYIGAFRHNVSTIVEAMNRIYVYERK
jgi:ABC-type Zn uptake system ZnuABC Zn-binding protein ZnuA